LRIFLQLLTKGHQLRYLEFMNAEKQTSLTMYYHTQTITVGKKSQYFNKQALSNITAILHYILGLLD